MVAPVRTGRTSCRRRNHHGTLCNAGKGQVGGTSWKPGRCTSRCQARPSRGRHCSKRRGQQPAPVYIRPAVLPSSSSHHTATRSPTASRGENGTAAAVAAGAASSNGASGGSVAPASDSWAAWDSWAAACASALPTCCCGGGGGGGASSSSSRCRFWPRWRSVRCVPPRAGAASPLGCCCCSCCACCCCASCCSACCSSSSSCSPPSLAAALVERRRLLPPLGASLRCRWLLPPPLLCLLPRPVPFLLPLHLPARSLPLPESLQGHGRWCRHAGVGNQGSQEQAQRRRNDGRKHTHTHTHLFDPRSAPAPPAPLPPAGQHLVAHGTVLVGAAGELFGHRRPAHTPVLLHSVFRKGCRQRLLQGHFRTIALLEEMHACRHTRPSCCWAEGDGGWNGAPVSWAMQRHQLPHSPSTGPHFQGNSIEGNAPPTPADPPTTEDPAADLSHLPPTSRLCCAASSSSRASSSFVHDACASMSAARQGWQGWQGWQEGRRRRGARRKGGKKQKGGQRGSLKGHSTTVPPSWPPTNLGSARS